MKSEKELLREIEESLFGATKASNHNIISEISKLKEIEKNSNIQQDIINHQKLKIDQLNQKVDSMKIINRIKFIIAISTPNFILNIFGFMKDKKGVFSFQDIEIIRKSEFFDENYYLSQNPKPNNKNIDGVLHFLRHGKYNLKNPSKLFDVSFYLKQNPDVDTSGVNPLLHYLYYGKSEGRMPLSLAKNTYKDWIANFDTLSNHDVSKIIEHTASLPLHPLLSVIMPVYNPKIEYLKIAINSIINQLYTNWELCIADDASTNIEVINTLKEYELLDKRIKVVCREQNGHISEASNSAINISNGEFLVLVDNDDIIPQHALYLVVNEINDFPNSDIIYSDEDKMDEQGNRFEPYMKSDWNPDLFYGHNFISHLGVFRSSLVKTVGAFRKGYEGSQDYDLAFRCIEQTSDEKIRHIPHVLYHWRAIEGSTALSEGEKDYAFNAGKKAIESHFDRVGPANVKVMAAPKTGYRTIWPVPKEEPLVSIIIPTKDKVALLKNCIKGILYETDYKNFAILIIDNNSSEKKTFEYYDTIKNKPNINIIEYKKEFNYSAINNYAVSIAKGEIIAFLNNDIEIIHKEWLKEMVSHVVRPEIGAVGAKLYYANNTLQHGGVIMGMGGGACHIHKNIKRDDPGYFGKAQLLQNFSCITAACMLIRKSVFKEVGQFNEENLAIAFNDVDLCMKIREKGYYITWTPFAELYHLESASRGADTKPEQIIRFQSELKYIQDKWNTDTISDPYFNSNFSLGIEHYVLDWPRKTKKVWL